MPKIYSEKERKQIRQRLHEAADLGLREKGVRKTTVDWLVETAGIPKGTFYLFYQSKEELLFEIIQEYHEQVEGEMLRCCMDGTGHLTVDSLTDIITEGILFTMNSCLKTIMIPGEIEQLIKKLPAKVVEEHLNHDNDLLGDMLGQMRPDLPAENRKAFSGAFRAIFFACLYPKEIRTEQFGESIRLLTRGMVLQMIGNEGQKA